MSNAESKAQELSAASSSVEVSGTRGVVEAVMCRSEGEVGEFWEGGGGGGRGGEGWGCRWKGNGRYMRRVRW